MASRVWGENDALQGMATQLAAMLSADGKKEREAWHALHEKLAEIAASIADPTMTIEAAQGKLKEVMGSLDLGHADAEFLLRQMMGICWERIMADSANASNGIHMLKDLILLVAGHLNMIPVRDLSVSKHEDMQMIDVDTFCEEKVNTIVNGSAELSAPNAPYAVVSIVGAQSSGKSYLLNQLFRTNFPVMNAKTGSNQTTKGILMSRCIGPSLIILDIEGFDGVEKGQDTKFENQAALFALTISDLLIVNMSVHDIGRLKGGGATLFQTIFQERTKLSPGLTKILVVLRYYDGETPLELLAHKFKKRLEEMWRSVQMERAEFNDYIEVKVTALPDKNSQHFQKEVTELRKLLSNIIVDNDRGAKVPASSFSLSSKLLWEEIKQNKRLDIPSHKVLIATIYCRQIVEHTIKSLGSREDYELLKVEESPQSFRQISDELLHSVIIKYDQQTEMYDPNVRDKERQSMVDTINKLFKEHSGELLRKTRESMAELFKYEISTSLENIDESQIDAVSSYDGEAVDLCIVKFTNMCEDLKVFDQDYFHNICAQLQKDLLSYATSYIIKLKEERARTEMEREKEKQQYELNKKVEEMTLERHRVEEEAKREKEKQEHAHNKKMEEMALERQRMEEALRLEREKRDCENNKRSEEVALERQREKEEAKREKEEAKLEKEKLEREHNRRASEEAKRTQEIIAVLRAQAQQAHVPPRIIQLDPCSIM